MPILALPALRLSPATDYPRYYYYCVLNLISASASLSAIRRLTDPLQDAYASTMYEPSCSRPRPAYHRSDYRLPAHHLRPLR